MGHLFQTNRPLINTARRYCTTKNGCKLIFQHLLLSTGKKYVFQHWMLIGSCLGYLWFVIGKHTKFSNIGKWLCFPMLVYYKEFTNIGMIIPNIGKTKSANIGIPNSNIGKQNLPILAYQIPTLESKICQHWYSRIQYWKTSCTNIGVCSFYVGKQHFPTLAKESAMISNLRPC